MMIRWEKRRKSIATKILCFLLLHITLAQQQGLDLLLQRITNLTDNASGNDCAGYSDHFMVKLPIDLFHNIREKIDLIGRLLGDTHSDILSYDDQELVKSSICRTSQFSSEIRTVRYLHYGNAPVTGWYFSPDRDTEVSSKCHVKDYKNIGDKRPWYRSPKGSTWNSSVFQNSTIKESLGRWTFPYFLCGANKWIISYVRPTTDVDSPERFRGSLSVDIDLSYLDVNQCNSSHGLSHFRNTHKCHRQSSTCVFESNLGWRRGSYDCECKEGFYTFLDDPFNGSYVEVAWDRRNDSNIYDTLYTCRQCASGCKNCTDDTPCEAEFNNIFRITLLSISVLCIILTFILMAIVFHYRRVKVFKVASPPFLQICLIGCIIMYLEMATIFPELDMASCIATKWARHMGFCITFSSLLMKTWRVSLTYRVKSAHKIKLEDNQLLQWMTPILLIMIIYLAAWTISDPPEGEICRNSANLIFKQCTYDTWDHCLAAGEMFFLLWGVKVCFGVRKAESFFDEAKCISWAVYSITIVNVFMATVHVHILPNAGPDWKYLFGFIRTQLSTSITIGLVFGPKLLRILKGTGDQLENNTTNAKGTTTASFSINGVGNNEDIPLDPTEENEELKEEIQKLAAQIEFMKIVHMEVNNRHLKPKASGYFTEKNAMLASIAGQSPIGMKPSKTDEISTLGGSNATNEPPPERV